jgi:hypothetical protein
LFKGFPPTAKPGGWPCCSGPASGHSPYRPLLCAATSVNRQFSCPVAGAIPHVHMGELCLLWCCRKVSDAVLASNRCDATPPRLK